MSNDCGVLFPCKFTQALLVHLVFGLRRMKVINGLTQVIKDLKLTLIFPIDVNLLFANIIKILLGGKPSSKRFPIVQVKLSSYNWIKLLVIRFGWQFFE